MSVDILVGDARDVLRTLPDQHFHTCVTSPPYFGLRDYGVEGQLGLEPTPDEFVAALVAVFREVRRVLRDDGTVWLNLGDSYAAGGHGGGGSFMKMRGGDGSEQSGAWSHRKEKKGWRSPPEGLKQKDLIGIPWMVAFALRADGWYLRQDIIWSKPNPMPESVRDRCTKSHEYLFLLSKGPRYYWGREAMQEPVQSNKGNGKSFRGGGSYTGGNSFNNHSLKGRETHGNAPNETGKRNRRSVWSVTTRPFKEAHFATFPPALVEPCIKAGCPAGGNVLDPFAGAGTTGLVAARHGRNATLIELSPAYAEMARKRIDGDVTRQRDTPNGAFNTTVERTVKQSSDYLSVFD